MDSFIDYNTIIIHSRNYFSTVYAWLFYTKSPWAYIRTILTI